jgi:hypothetical protein
MADCWRSVPRIDKTIIQQNVLFATSETYFFSTLLERMEVGRRVIIEEHPDQDSVESADRWHMRVSMTPNRAPRWW